MSQTTELLSRLVEINSINPNLVPGSPGESEIADFVRSWLVEHGVGAVAQETALGGRQNVIARVESAGTGPKLLLNAHMDTVGVGAMKDPFDARVEHGRLYGRGSLDTKGGLAAAMSAMALLAETRPPGDVILTAVVDEEHGSLGTAATTQNDAQAAIVYEPTDLDIVITHKGFIWLDVDVTGRAAHGSRPDLGIDAVTKASKVVANLESLNHLFAGMPEVEHLTRQSIHASLIEGGQERSTYAGTCRVGLEVRTHPGTATGEIVALVEGRIEALATSDTDISASVHVKLDRSGLEGDTKSPIVLALQEAASDVLGTPGVLSGHDGWMDSALLAEAGIPAVVFGPSGEGLHAAVEWVDLESVRQCRDVTVRAAQLFGSSS